MQKYDTACHIQHALKKNPTREVRRGIQHFLGPLHPSLLSLDIERNSFVPFAALYVRATITSRTIKTSGVSCYRMRYVQIR